MSSGWTTAPAGVPAVRLSSTARDASLPGVRVAPGATAFTRTPRGPYSAAQLRVSGDVLARNALLRAVLGRPLEPGTSCTRFLFQDPIARERIVNWADFASASVAALRREAGRRPHDRRLPALIEELRAADPDVARWGDDHAVRDYRRSRSTSTTPAPARCRSTSRSSPHPMSPTSGWWSTPPNRIRRPPACSRSSPAGTSPPRPGSASGPWPGCPGTAR